MSSEDGDPESSPISPDEAFAVLGNETRMEILQTLAEADSPLSFSELRDRVGMRDSGQFDYHLDKLREQFVREVAEGYELDRAGNRVIQAVLSGAITEAPTLEPTEVDDRCVHCGASTVVRFHDGHVRHYCTECSGTYGDSTDGPESSRETESRTWVGAEDSRSRDGTADLGFLGKAALPPAGVQGRTPTEAYRTAAIWGALDLLALGRGVCPRCSAPVERSTRVCDDHEAGEGVCDRCASRHAVVSRASCTNCTCDVQLPLALFCLADPEILAFSVSHGIDPLEDWATLDWATEITATDPFEGRVTYAVDDETVTVTVDESLDAIAAATSSTD